MSTNNNVYPLAQVLKNMSFIRSTINVHLKDEGVDKEAWLAIASQVAALQARSLSLINNTATAQAPTAQQAPAAPTNEAPQPDGQVTIIGKTVYNKVAARMAQRAIGIAAKSAKNALRLSKKPEKIAVWEGQLNSLREEYRKATAYINNPLNPEL